MTATGSTTRGRRWGTVALFAGAVVFLFPFYYMVIGSLQKEPDTTSSGALPLGGLTLHNYAAIDSRVDLVRSLVNSGIFTGGVLLCTVVFGVLAGYALARLHFRGRGTLFALMLLVQIVPFQLLIIPMYVMIVRTYGLADTYLGMIVPFAINSTAVFIFRQFFLQLPDDLFAAAALDGASELRILWSVALPLVRPARAHRRAAHLHRPVERVPLAVPGDQGPEPAAARGVAGELHQQRRRPGRQPVRRDPRRRRRARCPGRGAFRRLPAALHRLRPQQWSEGMTMQAHQARLRRWRPCSSAAGLAAVPGRYRRAAAAGPARPPHEPRPPRLPR